MSVNVKNSGGGCLARILDVVGFVLIAYLLILFLFKMVIIRSQVRP